MNISQIRARTILDSRGFPTVEADVILRSGVQGRAAVPSGASTGEGEALELRDGDPSRFAGKGVETAVRNIHEIIAPALHDLRADDQFKIDQALLELDDTENKSHLGANAMLAVSLACAHAAALERNVPLYQQAADIAGNKRLSMPVPMMNILNGGKHASGSTDIQEFMIIPKSAPTFFDAVRMGAEVFHALKTELQGHVYATTVGDEGGYAPAFKNGNAEALEMIGLAVERAGYRFGEDIVAALDVAASELYVNGRYTFATENRDFAGDELVDWYEALTQRFPIISIEDGLSEHDWGNWKLLTARLGHKLQLVGDDLLVTNTQLLRRAIDDHSANAILIKPNQIGTLTETIRAVQMAQNAGFNTVMSHRSGETEDVTIAHLAVGLGCGQIKTGSLSRSERLAKYNELIRIEEATSLPLAQPFFHHL